MGVALKGHNHFPASRSLPNIVNDQPGLSKGKRGLILYKPEPPDAKPVSLLFLLAARCNVRPMVKDNVAGKAIPFLIP